jgi:hypothetical protein
VKNKKGKDRDKEKALKKRHNKENSKKINDKRVKTTEKIVMPLTGVIIRSCKTYDV